MLENAERSVDITSMQTAKDVQIKSEIIIRENIESLNKLLSLNAKVKSINHSYLGKKIYQETLKNGLSIIIIPDKTLEKRYISWNVNCGSANTAFWNSETYQNFNHGIASYLEYELLERRTIIGDLRELKNCCSSQTYKNYTNYSLTAEDDFLELLPKFLKAMQEPLKYYDLKESERFLYRKVLLEEKSEYQILYDGLLRLMYTNRNIYLDKYGFIDNLNISFTELQRFYSAYYSPENIVIVAIGDFDISNLLEHIKKNIFIKKESFIKVNTDFNQEIRNYYGHKKEIKLNYNENYFAIGIKLPVENSNIVKRKVLLEILMEEYFGNFSDFRNDVDKKDLLKDFFVLVENNKLFSHIVILGKSNDRYEISRRVRKIFKNIPNSLMDLGQFDLSKTRLLKRIEKLNLQSLNNEVVLEYFEDSKDINMWTNRNYFDVVSILDTMKKMDNSEIFELNIKVN